MSTPAPNPQKGSATSQATSAPTLDLPGGRPRAPDANTLPLDARLRAARPRLLALARLRGLPTEDAEEIAQETLVTAWRQLATLRDPARFDAWLDGICRTLCLRLLSERARAATSLVPLGSLANDADESFDLFAAQCARDGDGVPMEELPDPTLGDLSDDLCQADLHALLDRALASLSAPTRAAIVLAYLDEVPQREAAARLGLSLGALEARLHRARAELRQVLAGPLRAEAESFGLLVGDDEGAGWRESREWCMVCGQRRMRGTFERMPDGQINLRMRCSVCSPRLGNDVVSTFGFVALEGLRSFRPALARVFRSPLVQGIGRMDHPCPTCGGPAGKRVEMGAVAGVVQDRYWIVCTCPRCGTAASWLTNVAWAHPKAQVWMRRHPRYLLWPDTAVSFDGVRAVRVRMEAVVAPARFDLFIDPRTLAVLGCVEE